MANEERIIFNRPPRVQRSLPKGDVEIPPPPQPNFKGGKMGWLVLVLPVVLALLTLLGSVMIVIFRPDINFIYLLATGLMATGFLVSSVVNVFERLMGDREERRNYSRILEETENELRNYRREQQTILHYLYPALPQIFEWPGRLDLRLWERRPLDPDFMSLRLGIGSRLNNVSVNTLKKNRPAPMLDRAIGISQAYQEIPDVPDMVELGKVAFLGLVGPQELTAPFMRSIVCHLAALHSPEDVKVLATYSPTRGEDWFWLGWLPHARVGNQHGEDFPLVASHSDQLEVLSNFVLETLKARQNRRDQEGSGFDLNINKPKAAYTFPNLVWFVENFELVQDEPAIKKLFEVGAELGVYLVTTSSELSGIPAQCRAVAEILPNGRVRYSTAGENGRVTTLLPDLAALEECEDFSLAMAPIKLKATSEKGEFTSSLRLLDMLELSTVSKELFDPLAFWNRSAVAQLKAPIGRVFGGQPLFLDISDKGHGPHGLVAGTTGSGKSELLLTIVSSLALTNHPDNLNFILGDFKGGATFNPFLNLPHVVGMMSDLDLPIVERAMTAIFSELKRREHLLKEENVTHIRDYQKKKPRPKTPLPYLLVIIDEFAEMKEQAPDFMDKIVNIARTGRTLGVHLILATQRPAGIVSGQLNSNTKFRLCLRVESSDDSVDMLGRKDAALIPSNAPGRSFFKVGSDIYEQFQVARVAVPFEGGEEGQDDEQEIKIVDHYWRAAPLSPDKTSRSGDTSRSGSIQFDDEEDNSVAMDYDMIVRQCLDAARRTIIRNTHRPWLEPLRTQYFLPELFEGQAPPAFGLKSEAWPENPPFGYGCVPVASVDDVVAQDQYSLMMDLARQGSYCISGLGVSGKTTLLRSMLLGLAQTHAPDQVRFAIVDMGNTLGDFGGLPHRTGYVSMSQKPLMNTFMRDLYEELQRRKNLFARAGVLDLASFRQQENPLPVVFIAFDNFASIRHDPPFDMEYLKAIVREGRAYGMHLAITMERAMDFEHGRMMDEFFQVALRQSRDDIIFPVPRNMVGSWDGKPGRGFIRGLPHQPPLEIHVALPCKTAPEDQSKAISAMVGRLSDAAQQDGRYANLNQAAPLNPAPVTGEFALPKAEESLVTGATGAGSDDYWKKLLTPDEDEELEIIFDDQPEFELMSNEPATIGEPSTALAGQFVQNRVEPETRVEVGPGSEIFDQPGMVSTLPTEVPAVAEPVQSDDYFPELVPTEPSIERADLPHFSNGNGHHAEAVPQVVEVANGSRNDSHECSVTPGGKGQHADGHTINGNGHSTNGESKNGKSNGEILANMVQLTEPARSEVEDTGRRSFDETLPPDEEMTQPQKEMAPVVAPAPQPIRKPGLVLNYNFEESPRPKREPRL